MHQVLQWSFKSTEINHDVYRGKDCMKMFCKSLREHTIEKMKLLTKEQQESYENAKIFYFLIFKNIFKEVFEEKYAKYKIIL